MQYGVLAVKQSPRNLGDDVQGLAAMRFLPSTDLWLDRDDPREAEGGPEVFAFHNGWFTWRPDRFPPPKNVKPFWIAFHCATPHLLSAAMLEHLKAHEPIGARDLHTLALLRNAGVSAYWSGCLTATLPRYDGPRSDETLMMDVQRKMVRYVPRAIRRRARKHTNDVKHPVDPAARMELTQQLVERLSKARLVVTSRLHVAIPCAAVGTPCVMVHAKVNSDIRFGGIRGNLFRGYDRFTMAEADWDPKPLDIEPMRKFLRTVAQAAVKHQGNPFPHESIELPEVVRRVGGPVGTRWM